MSSKAVTLSLYRSILKYHARHLPTQMRSLGDAYVQSEFKAHKTVTNTEQLDQFFTAWNKYLLDMQSKIMVNHSTNNVSDVIEGKKIKFGSEITSDVELSDEQKFQLDKLREEAIKTANE